MAMNVLHVPIRSSLNPDPPNPANTYLHGRWLIIARSATVAMAVFALGAFFAGISPLFHELVTLSLQAEQALRQLPAGGGHSFLQVVLSVNLSPIYDLPIDLIL